MAIQRRMMGGLAVLAATALLAACGASTMPAGSAPVTSDIPDPNGTLAQEAKKEGSVVWYAPTLGNIKAIQAAFQELYGIPVNAVTQPSVQLEARFQAESESGKQGGDVLTAGYDGFFAESLEKGWTTPLKEALSDFPGSYPAAFLKDDGGTAITFTAPVSVAYNTKEVTEADIPTSWEDLAKPYWAGKIISVDPNASIAYLQLWDAILDKYGEDKVRAIGKNIKRTYATAPAELQALTSGEGTLALFSSAGLTQPLIDQGAPVANKIFDYTTGSNFAIALASKGPHPSAGKLFAQWLLSKGGQQKVVELARNSAPLVPGTMPASYAEPNIHAADTRAKINELLGVSAG